MTHNALFLAGPYDLFLFNVQDETLPIYEYLKTTHPVKPLSQLYQSGRKAIALFEVTKRGQQVAATRFKRENPDHAALVFCRGVSLEPTVEGKPSLKDALDVMDIPVLYDTERRNAEKSAQGFGRFHSSANGSMPLPLASLRENLNRNIMRLAHRSHPIWDQLTSKESPDGRPVPLAGCERCEVVFGDERRLPPGHPLRRHR